MLKRGAGLFIIFICCSAFSLLYHKENFTGDSFPQDFFAWPVKGKIDLTGNFGELRTNHFHSGLDIRTGAGTIGIPIYAAGDGFIGRINVSSKGYGKALYIFHPNGFTSVYGHLSAFVNTISTYTEIEQYKRSSFEVELYPDKDLIPVKKGDLIAYSGNTGGSAGPHLHFEIRNTQSEIAINPLLFGLKLTDNVKPNIQSITLFKVYEKEEVRLNTGSYPYEQYARKGHSISQSIITVSPGVYALGASWVDYLRKGGFRMGIPYAKLFVNNKLVFEQKIESMPFADWRMVNCHIDHPLLETRNLKIIKLFRDEGNTLDIYPSSRRIHLFKKNNDTNLHYPKFSETGLIFVDNSENLIIKLVISDFPGHKDSVQFTIKGNSVEFKNPQKKLEPKINPKHKSEVFYRDKKNEMNVEGEEETIKITVPSGILYDKILFRAGPSNKRINGHQVWDIMNSSIPIHDSFSIAFKPVNPFINPEKYVIIRLTSDGKKKPEGTSWLNGSIQGKAKMLGEFYYDIDTTSPVISMVKVSGRRFSAKVKDDLSGIYEIKTLIDNQWILYDYEPKLDLITGKFPESVSNGVHLFHIIVKDNRGNIREYSETIMVQ